MRKNTTFTIEESLSKRLSVVSKKMKRSKSGIVEELIEGILPILEAETPNQMLAKAMKKMAVQIDLTGNLFEDIEKDESIERYKEMKRG